MSARLLSIALVLALSSPALAAGKNDVDRTVPMPKDGLAKLGWRVKGLVFEEVALRNLPKPRDLEEARHKPSDESHPKFAIGISNLGKQKKKVKVEIRLEAADGKVLMSCDRKDSVDPGKKNAYTNLCWLEGIRTLDWPKVTRFRVVATVD